MFMKEPHTALFVAPTGVAKYTFSIGFTRERIQKLFRFHYNNLPHVKTQRNIQDSIMGLD